MYDVTFPPKCWGKLLRHYMYNIIGAVAQTINWLLESRTQTTPLVTRHIGTT